MIIFIIAVALTFLSTGCQSCQFSGTFDPCSSENHKPFPYMEDRCPTCDNLSNDRNDLYDLDHDIWYGTEYNMTTKYVSPYGCGTQIPIWMNGTIPMMGDGVVSRKACVATFEKLCASSYSINVKRCNPYYTVYCLENLPNNQQRYCFDIDPSLFTTTTSARTSAKLQTMETSPPKRRDGERIPLLKETGVEGWVIAVIATLSITIFGLLMIILVILRQFRRNHKKHTLYASYDMPPPYKQEIDAIPKKSNVMVTFLNVQPKY